MPWWLKGVLLTLLWSVVLGLVLIGGVALLEVLQVGNRAEIEYEAGRLGVLIWIAGGFLICFYVVNTYARDKASARDKRTADLYTPERWRAPDRTDDDDESNLRRL
jgi:hypothetical protein